LPVNTRQPVSSHHPTVSSSERANAMRSSCSYFAGVVLTFSMITVAPGCGSGTSDLENAPATPKKVDPMTDMPGLKQQQEQLKKDGKIK
jgi:hypothetical protein